MLTRVRISIYGFLLLFCLLTAFAAQAQDGTPSQILVNYSEVSESADQQNLNVYFTVLDAGGRFIANPTVNTAQININNQSYPAIVSVPQTPLNIVLVLDASGSMQPAAEIMRQAAIQAVNQAPPNALLSVIQFNEQIVTRVGFTSDKGAVINAIGQISNSEFKGGTCLYDASYQALQQLQSSAAAGRRALVLFTDGRDELIAGGALDPCSKNADYNKLVETARNPQLRVPIYTIGLSGTQAINLDELVNLANATGGLPAAGSSDTLTQLFQQIIQALAAQRQATATTCLQAGNYGGLINVDVNGSNLPGQINSVNFGTSCVLPTATPTPRALTISVGDFRIDPASNEIMFTVERSGDGDVAQYEIEILDEATRLQVEGQYGKFTIPADQTRDIRIPIAGISALKWLVKVTALDANGGEIAQSAESPIGLPTPTPTVTPTLTATPSATPTAPVPAIQIRGIDFLEDSGDFLIDWLPINFEIDQVNSYTLRIENAGKNEVYRETRSDSPAIPLRVKAVDNNQRALPAGEYNIIIELNLPGQPLLRAERTISPPPPPSPTPSPSFIETLPDTIQKNPVIAAIFGLFVLSVMLFLILLLRRRGREAEPAWYTAPASRRPESRRPSGSGRQPGQGEMIDDSGTQALVGPADEGTFGDKGGKLKLLSSPVDKVGQEWNFTSRDVPYRIGRGGSSDYPVKLDLKDPGVSANHATIRFLNGQYWIIDDNSTNGTYIDGERLKVGQRHPLESAQKIRFGLSTEFEFTDKNKEFKDRLSDAKKTAPLDIRGLAHQPPTQEKPVEIQNPASPAASFDDLEDAPTSVTRVLPPYITARMEIISGTGVQPGVIQVISDEFTIGRKKDNHLPIESREVSRRHARLYWQSGYFYIEDLGSGNGTYLYDKQIVKDMPKEPDAPFELSPVRLLTNEIYEIRLGADENAVRMRFQYQNKNQPPAPPPGDLEDAPTIVPE